MSQKVKFKQANAYNYQKGRLSKLAYIVIHDVGGVSSAANNAAYFSNGKPGVSAHYFVDDNEIWQSVKDTDTAWHCGSGGVYAIIHPYCRNANSIGIEMCLAPGYKITEKTFNNTIEFVKSLMKKYGIPAVNVIRHKDVTTKQCPGSLSLDRWNAIKKAIGGISVSAPAKQSAPPDSKPTLKAGNKGDAVKKLQKLLNKHGYKLGEDGIFGVSTLKAVKAFQKKKDLTPDGIVGSKTWAVL